MHKKELLTQFLTILYALKNTLSWQPRFHLVSKPSLHSSTDDPISQLPPEQRLQKLQQSVSHCSKCELSRSRNKTVFGSGDPKSPLIIIGEGPGHDEDLQGLPFVGRAGQLLTKMLAAISISRERVYITNIVKCRPPQNRNPRSHEMQACFPYLQAQLDLIKAPFIVTLGRIASQTILNTTVPISKLRGTYYQLNTQIVVPIYHPAALLRNPPLKKDAWQDLQILRDLLIRAKLFSSLTNTISP